MVCIPPITTLVTNAVPVIKHALWRTISVICVLLVVGGVVWGGYIAFVKPHTKPTPTTIENAETINYYIYNYYPSKRSFSLGFTLGGVDIGIAKYSYPSYPVSSVYKKEIIPKVEKK